MLFLLLPLFRLFLSLSFLLFPSHFSSLPPIPFGQNCVRPLHVEESHSLFETEQGDYFSNGTKARFTVHVPSSGFVSSDGWAISKGRGKILMPKKGLSRRNWEFSALSALVVHLSFVLLDLEPPYSKSEQCLRDYVVVTIIDRDGREHNSDRICGDRRPEPMHTMQSRARILFIASSSLSSNEERLPKWKGFRMKFEFVPESTILAPSSFYYDTDRRHLTECGGVNSPAELSGVIHSPGFPYTFPRNVTCNWLLRVAPDHRINIRLLEIELSSAFECERASLQFFDGFRHDFELDKSFSTFPLRHPQQPTATDALFCGGSAYYGEEGMKSFLSERNRVFVRFTTRKSPTQKQFADYATKIKPIGFRLIWTEVQSLVYTSADDPRTVQTSLSGVTQESFVTVDQCAGFVCSGGEFCVDATENICVERTRLCINETLRCDGLANCAENDQSDESFCYVQKVLSLVTFPLLFLCSLLFSLFCFSYCILKCLREKKEQKQRKKETKRKEEILEEKRERKRGEKCVEKETDAAERRRAMQTLGREDEMKAHGRGSANDRSFCTFADPKNAPKNGSAKFMTNVTGHFPCNGQKEWPRIRTDSEVWTKQSFAGEPCHGNGIFKE